MKVKRIAVLGSTGSIGRQALDVVLNNKDKLQIVALAAGNNVELLAEQIQKFTPGIVAVASSEDALKLKKLLTDSFNFEVTYGQEGLEEVAAFDECDVVLNAVTGTVGLTPTLKAIEAGKDIAIANKETLVAAGHLVMEAAREKGVNIYPVDSEHSAIWQCIKNDDKSVSKIILTASGGPFRQMSILEMESVTREMALNHPNWNMGNKITIDSATLMNKGLEVIEARWLFDIDFDHIEVVVHPQSIVHSMVEFVDGSVIAHLGIPDMRIPIQYALSYPERWTNDLPKLKLSKIKQLTFEDPDYEKFPCLKLAYQAGITGGTMPAVLNAANEVAVNRFLNNEIKFTDIYKIVSKVMSKHTAVFNPDLKQILDADKWAREEAKILC